MKFLVIIEPAGGNWSGWVPDLPGCIATGKSAAQVRRRLADAISLHLRGLYEDGEDLPSPIARCDYVKVKR